MTPGLDWFNVIIPTVSPVLAFGVLIVLPLESVTGSPLESVTSTSSAFTLNIIWASESIALSGIWPKSL